MASFSFIRTHITTLSLDIVLFIVVAVAMQLGTALGRMSQMVHGQTASPEDALTSTAVYRASVAVAVSPSAQSQWLAITAVRKLFGSAWVL